jgi:hypothetical protein
MQEQLPRDVFEETTGIVFTACLRRSTWLPANPWWWILEVKCQPKAATCIPPGFGMWILFAELAEFALGWTFLPTPRDCYVLMV